MWLINGEFYCRFLVLTSNNVVEVEKHSSPLSQMLVKNGQLSFQYLGIHI